MQNVGIQVVFASREPGEHGLGRACALRRNQVSGIERRFREQEGDSYQKSAKGR